MISSDQVCWKCGHSNPANASRCEECDAVLSMPNNGKAAVAASSRTFRVHIKNLAGAIETIECSSDMNIQGLIDKLRQTLPNSEKGMEINLMLPIPENGNGADVNFSTLKLKPSDILEKKGIMDGTELNVFYNNISPSCIHPFPNGETFHEHLHRWIEEQDEKKRIDFDPPFKTEEQARANMNAAWATQVGPNGPPRIPAPGGDSLRKHHAIRNTSLLVNHNDWTWDQPHLFFLTNSEIDNFERRQQFPSATMGIPVAYYSEMTYSQPYPRSQNKVNLIYSPVGISSPEQDTITIPNNSSIKGTLTEITIAIMQMYKNDHYTRSFTIWIILSGPITIRDPNGEILLSLDNSKAVCWVPYDLILMCNANNKLPLSRNALQAANVSNPNNYINSGNTNSGNKTGGRRRTKRLKRSKNKRKSRHQ